MEVKVNLSGMEDLEQSMKNAEDQMKNLWACIDEINRALVQMRLEINQPTAGAIG